jgi:type I restriction enzyme S subunit
VAKNDSDDDYIISPAYYTFKLNGIDPEYFMINVSRYEFERRAWFSCDTSARGSLSWSEFCNLEIPNASFEQQKNIANLYRAYKCRCNINERLKMQIKDICPILIKGAVEEGANE